MPSIARRRHHRANCQAQRVAIEAMERRTLLSAAAGAPPVSIVINSTKDQIDPAGSATVTLRDAIARADASSGPVSIGFDPKPFAVAQTIALRQGTLSLTHNTFGLITLKAAAPGLIIQGQKFTRLLDVGQGVSLNLRGVVLSRGGGIENDGAMTLSRSAITHNTASLQGGGIYNTGSFTLLDSTVNANAALQGFSAQGFVQPGEGGGAYNAGTMVIRNCSISSNNTSVIESNGAAVDSQGSLTLANTTISNNGGGTSVAVFTNGQSSFTSCTLSNNLGVGIQNGIPGGQSPASSCTVVGCTIALSTFLGIDSIGVLSVNNSSITKNNGGISADDATITNSTIAGNISESSTGGITADGKLNLTNCTVTGNGSTFSFGGGLSIFTSEPVIISDCTFTNNFAAQFGGGIASGTDQQSQTSVTIANTLIAGNTVNAGGSGPDVAGAVNSPGHNLIGQTDGSSGWIASDLRGTTAKPLNPKLSPLSNHGGPTQTQLPLTGSPAIGGGSVALIPKGIATDQRGDPRVVNGKVDIGAVEV